MPLLSGWEAVKFLLLVVVFPFVLIIAFCTMAPSNKKGGSSGDPSSGGMIGPHGGFMLLAHNDSSGNTYPVEVIVETGLVGSPNDTIWTATRIYFKQGGSVALRDCHCGEIEDLDELGCYDANGTYWVFLKFIL